MAQAPKLLAIDVYKSPTCGCCEDWVKHLRDSFTVATHDVEDTGVYRKKYGIPDRRLVPHRCHPRLCGIEGHVPAADIKKLLASAAGAGLAGRGHAGGIAGHGIWSRKDPFDVLLVKPAARRR
jgi:hypothetical protein